MYFSSANFVVELWKPLSPVFGYVIIAPAGGRNIVWLVKLSAQTSCAKS